MAYTNIAKILISIPEHVLASLIDDIGAPPALTNSGADAVITQLITDADHWVDSYAAKVLEMPVTDTGLIEDLETCARIHVIFNAYGRRSRSDVNPMTEQYKAAERWLMALQRGDVVITDSTHNEQRASRVNVVLQTNNNDTTYGRFDLRYSVWSNF